MFDNFLADLFANNLDIKKMGLAPGSNMPLDKSLLMHTAKKHHGEMLLHSESAGPLLSNLQVRDGSAANMNLLSSAGL